MDNKAAMDSTPVREKVRELTGLMAPSPGTAVTPDMSLVDDLGYDSLRLLTLIMEIFDTYELTLPGPGDVVEFDGISTVAQLEQLIVSRTERVAAGGQID